MYIWRHQLLKTHVVRPSYPTNPIIPMSSSCNIHGAYVTYSLRNGVLIFSAPPNLKITSKTKLLVVKQSLVVDFSSLKPHLDDDFRGVYWMCKCYIKIDGRAISLNDGSSLDVVLALRVGGQSQKASFIVLVVRFYSQKSTLEIELYWRLNMKRQERLHTWLAARLPTFKRNNLKRNCCSK